MAGQDINESVLDTTGPCGKAGASPCATVFVGQPYFQSRGTTAAFPWISFSSSPASVAVAIDDEAETISDGKRKKKRLRRGPC
jgi:hypothetical protein